MVSCSRGRAAGINLHRSRFRRAQGSRQGEQVGSLACLLTRFEAAGSGSRREREREREGEGEGLAKGERALMEPRGDGSRMFARLGLAGLANNIMRPPH